ncbi:oligo-1,6-glucosidase [Algoriphagus iocasae]|uniref:Oligo-1,6-glucosidase n=1 Tax=Algoriphagus iocasae TaxID=1836499 RepID=A0A841MHJ9_9BACT|nr:alpha-glucosidase [Algoriphagus iocasae]MBB6324799.1 oligo-1,6-glucosidase [Algoriphagus iocasae]
MNRIFIISLLGIFLTACSEKVEKQTAEIQIDRQWWKEGTLYQIYPQSFKDTDGDGFGDFRGIIDELDYLQSLGITAVWMNPFFESPMVDNGYDVSNYRAINPRYGTMEDFEEMVKGMKERGIRFVLDVVVNHSSDQHEWFQSAKNSRNSEYRDYYHWWPAEKGEPPYRYSLFDPEGGWDYVKETDSYYLHTFAEQQPDLNWENPKLRQEVYDIMKFWAEKGVDGFRMDAFQFASKDITYPEFPEGYESEFIKYHGLRPALHDYLKEMYLEVMEPYNVFAVAEGAGSTFQDAHDLVDADRKELQVAYHFEYVDMSRTPAGYELSDFKEVFSRWDSAFAEKGWIAVFLSNHDNARLVDRFGNSSPEFRRVTTQLLNTFLLSMRGTPYTYYGDELGMTNLDMPTIEEYVDIDALGKYKAAKAAGQDMEEFMEVLNYSSRENARTPMQWNDSENAGFTTGTPWKRVNPNYKEINVEQQNSDPNSVLNHFRKMTKLRNENLVLVYGDYELLLPDHEQIYAYTRILGEDKMLVLLNFSDKPAEATLPEAQGLIEIFINNYDSSPIKAESKIVLEPYQAVIVKMN